MKWLFFICFLVFSSYSWAAGIHNMHIMTEDYPPFNYIEDGVLKGISTDILIEMLKQAEAPHQRFDIEVLPWPRGYAEIQQTPDTMLYSMTYTEGRKNLFKWVGPIVATEVSILAPGYRQGTASSFTIDNGGNYIVGAVKDDVGHLLLLEAGFPPERIELAPTLRNNIQKLIFNRIDFIACDAFVANWMLKAIRPQSKPLKTIHTLSKSELYYAFHKETPDATIERLQSILDQIKQNTSGNNLYTNIIQSYISQQPD